MTSSRSCVDTSYSDFERARLSLDRFTFSFFSAQKKKTGFFNFRQSFISLVFGSFRLEKKSSLPPPKLRSIRKKLTFLGYDVIRLGF